MQHEVVKSPTECMSALRHFHHTLFQWTLQVLVLALQEVGGTVLKLTKILNYACVVVSNLLF